MLYYVSLFVFILAIAYIMGIMIVTLIDRHLGKISINLPKQNIIVNMSNQQPIIKNEPEIEEKKEINANIEAFENYNLFDSAPLIPEIQRNICYKNHPHTDCIYGEMRYPQMNELSAKDKIYIKYNFQKNFTLQDYVNWLYLFNDNPQDLPYEHLKNLEKIKSGQEIKEIPNVNVEGFKDQYDYFSKMYKNLDKIKNEKDLPKYESFNINQYPILFNKK